MRNRQRQITKFELFEMFKLCDQRRNSIKITSHLLKMEETEPSPSFREGKVLTYVDIGMTCYTGPHLAFRTPRICIYAYQLFLSC